MADTRIYLQRLALELGAVAVQRINALSAQERMAKVPALLKPPPETSAYPDVLGETVAVEMLTSAAIKLGLTICVIGDPSKAHHIQVGPSSSQAAIWCYLDAVDGTLKLSGLTNTATRLRAVNDGSWALGIAFTDPTEAAIGDLALKDFTVSAIIDGCPSDASLYPKAVVAVKQGNSETFITTHADGKQLYTTSCDNVPRSMVYLDSFQAFDANTADPSDANLAKQLYCQLIDRTRGGAFDVLRTYGNLSSLIRYMLGWRDGAQGTELWLEPQCCGFIVLNENLANMVPCIAIILGAGGVAVDFDGNMLAARRLKQGRCSLIYAANENIARALLEHVRAARQQIAGAQAAV